MTPAELYGAVGAKIKNDEGVSPVIAVILMVAITVVLAATVYVWVSGFATEDSGPEQASAAAKGVDLNDDGDVEWIKITLTKGNNAPYNAADVTNSTTDNSGSSVGYVCDDASTSAGTYCDGLTSEFRDKDSDTWDVGESLWVPCQGSGNHVISIAVKGTAILDTTIECEAAAP